MKRIAKRLALAVILVILSLLLTLTGVIAALISALPGDKVGRYRRNLFIAWDQLGSTQLGGDPDETLSSRMGRAIRAGRCRGCYWVCRNILHRLDPDHCNKSIEDEGEDEVIFW